MAGNIFNQAFVQWVCGLFKVTASAWNLTRPLYHYFYKAVQWWTWWLVGAFCLIRFTWQTLLSEATSSELVPSFEPATFCFSVWRLTDWATQRLQTDAHLSKRSTFVSSVHRIFAQKPWQTSRCCLANVRRVFCCSFWSAVAFTLKLHHGRHFCSVSFLTLNRESWFVGQLFNLNTYNQHFNCVIFV